MLEDLDLIDWNSLRHAYGAAGDVPAMLRKIAAGDEAALDEAWGNIYHQGTVYPATVRAVPFLVQIAGSSTADRSGVLALLQGIAAGHEREPGVASAVRREVANGIPAYLAAAADPDPAVRDRAAHVIGSCVTAPDAHTSTALQSWFDQERDEVVSASLVFAIAATESEQETWFHERLTSAHPCVRAAAAMVLARRMTQISERVRHVLATDVPDAMEDLASLSWIQSVNDPIPVVTQSLQRWEDQVALIELWLQHDDDKVRGHAIFSADLVSRRWRAATPAIVALMIRTLQDKSPDIRRSAASTIATSGRTATAANSALLELLGREQLAWFTPASYALLSLCKVREPRVVPYLAKRLAGLVGEKARRAELPAELQEPIEALGSWAGDCLEPLVRLLPIVEGGLHGNARYGVIRALGRYQEAVTPAALDAIVSQVGDHPAAVCAALSDAGPAARSHAHAVAHLLQDEDHDIQATAVFWRCVGRADLVVPVLHRALTSDASEDRYRVFGALERIAEMGAAARDLTAVVQELVARLAAADPDARDARDHLRDAAVAAIALWRITGLSGALVPLLIDAFECSALGIAIARTLGEMGSAAADALPVLEAALASPTRGWTFGSVDEIVANDEAWMDACQAALRSIRNAVAEAAPPT